MQMALPSSFGHNNVVAAAAHTRPAPAAWHAPSCSDTQLAHTSKSTLSTWSCRVQAKHFGIPASLSVTTSVLMPTSTDDRDEDADESDSDYAETAISAAVANSLAYDHAPDAHTSTVTVSEQPTTIINLEADLGEDHARTKQPVATTKKSMPKALTYQGSAAVG